MNRQPPPPVPRRKQPPPPPPKSTNQPTAQRIPGPSSSPKSPPHHHAPTQPTRNIFRAQHPAPADKHIPAAHPSITTARRISVADKQSPTVSNSTSSLKPGSTGAPPPLPHRNPPPLSPRRVNEAPTAPSMSCRRNISNAAMTDKSAPAPSRPSVQAGPPSTGSKIKPRQSIKDSHNAIASRLERQFTRDEPPPPVAVNKSSENESRILPRQSTIEATNVAIPATDTNQPFETRFKFSQDLPPPEKYMNKLKIYPSSKVNPSSSQGDVSESVSSSSKPKTGPPPPPPPLRA